MESNSGNPNRYKIWPTQYTVIIKLILLIENTVIGKYNKTYLLYHYYQWDISMVDNRNDITENSLDPDTEKSRFLKKAVLKTPEGRLLIVGVILGLLYTLWLVQKVIFSAGQAQVLVPLTATEIVFGRAAGMAFGYSFGLGHKEVITICMILETILVLIFYPLFVFIWQQLLVIKRLRKIFDRTRRAAEANKRVVQKYGIVGLFLFVLFPFWMTGPVVGCMIGYMLGLRVWINITSVLAGTYVAIFAWALLMRHIQAQIVSYSSYAPFILTVLIILIISAIGYFWSRKTEREG